MAVTLRHDAKEELIRLLRQQGYATYARLVGYFDIYLTDNPDVVGYMKPAKAVIVLNMNLTMDQVSTVVRHEVLHEFLTHMERNKAFHELNAQYMPIHELANIAGDFEISNLGYTDADKREMKRLKLNGKTLQGLVTELDRPGWENLSYEEMYKRLLEENAAQEEGLKNLLQRISELNQQDIDDLIDAAEELINGEGSEEQNSSNGSNSSGEGDPEEETDAGSDARKAIQDAAGELKKQLKDIQDKQQQVDDYRPSDGKGGFMSQENQRDAVDVAARVSAIEKFLGDLRIKSDLLDEVKINRQKEKAVKAAQDIHKFQKSGLQQFKLTLNRFIHNELETEDKDTYTRIHPSYEDSDFIIPGRHEVDSKKIPSINVYWDASGSFSPPEKTAAARRAIETLNKYVRRGQLEMNVWYHGIRISDSFEGAGGGNTSNIVEEHILQTKPDNVIVITDGDLSHDTVKATVPGAVWMLFYDMRSSGLMNSLHGKKETKYFDIEYRNHD